MISRAAAVELQRHAERPRRHTPDPVAYPMFDAALPDGLRQETTLFFAEHVRKNLDLRGMLDADFTFLTARLAQHDRRRGRHRRHRPARRTARQRAARWSAHPGHRAPRHDEQPEAHLGSGARQLALQPHALRPAASMPANATQRQEELLAALGPNPTEQIRDGGRPERRLRPRDREVPGRVQERRVGERRLVRRHRSRAATTSSSASARASPPSTCSG